MTATGEAAGRAAREVRDHPVLDRMARIGLVVYGVVYVLIGWLAAEAGLGHPSGSASGSGALEEIAQKPLGSALLWLVAGGLAALVVWQVCQAIGGHRDDDGAKRWLARLGSAGRAVVLGVLSALAVRTALGDGGGGGGGTTGSLLRLSFGTLLVLAAAAVVMAVAVTSAWRGLTDRWRKDVEVEGRTGDVGRVVQVLARAGHLSRAAAFGVIAVLVGRAALEHDSQQKAGLDQAIVRFRDEPLGPWLIVVVAVGLACYGAYQLVRAWYLRSS
ncbi:DUF1206 domain-containing protein [Nocardioides aromaticivorans]|uniref:DUF1206 domain-containing protein n=1 Tax=Nocardioides aromaticivorans TaxID=200618 RepID=UPI001A8E0520|nr:DUF1206 domain-containing protein [Nocardioides aromaticivorans]